MVMEYEVRVDFCGCEETCFVEADSPEEAEDLAVDEAADLLYIKDVIEANDGGFSVVVGFDSSNGHAEQTYDEEVRSEHKAIDNAFEDAMYDISVVDVKTI